LPVLFPFFASREVAAHVHYIEKEFQIQSMLAVNYAKNRLKRNRNGENFPGFCRALFGKKALEDDVVVDATVQEKNITFPTDTRLLFRTYP
jgi:hypothetical protein